MTYLTKSTRTITEVFIHCTATLPFMDIGVKEIDVWHKERGWIGVGYHGVIRRSGEFEVGRDVNVSGAHASRHNAKSIGIALVGGLGSDNRPAPEFTRWQWATLKKVVAEMRQQYPDAVIRGHNELGGKACPSFDVREWLTSGDVVRVG